MVMKKQLVLSLMVLLSVTLSAQLQNMDFENWSQGNDSVHRPTNWVINQGWGQFGIFKDDYAQNGTYAIMLSRWYYYTFDDAVQTAATSIKPVELNGFFRYTGNLIQLGNDTLQDTAHVYVFAKKWNAVTQQNDTIGRGHVRFTEADYWTAFTCPIYYTTFDTPDSITIRLTPTERDLDGMGICLGNNDNGTCSFFSVDNLTLHEVTTGLTNTTAEQFKLFPNPATDKVYIATTTPAKNISYTVVDATGKTISGQTLYNTGDAIDISTLRSGIYFMVVNNNGAVSAQKIVKQ